MQKQEKNHNNKIIIIIINQKTYHFNSQRFNCILNYILLYKKTTFYKPNNITLTIINTLIIKIST